jgi:hypothetical protein
VDPQCEAVSAGESWGHARPPDLAAAQVEPGTGAPVPREHASASAAQAAVEAREPPRQETLVLIVGSLSNDPFLCLTVIAPRRA